MLVTILKQPFFRIQPQVCYARLIVQPVASEADVAQDWTNVLRKIHGK